MATTAPAPGDNRRKAKVKVTGRRRISSKGRHTVGGKNPYATSPTFKGGGQRTKTSQKPDVDRASINKNDAPSQNLEGGVGIDDYGPALPESRGTNQAFAPPEASDRLAEGNIDENGDPTLDEDAKDASNADEAKERANTDPTEQANDTAKKENQPTESDGQDTSGVDKKEVDSLYNNSGEVEEESGFKRLRKRITRRRVLIGGGIGGGVVASFLVFLTVSGPFQIVQFAQLLEQFHFTNIQAFGDDRSSRILYRYAKSGNIQQTRLGAVGNRVANSYETKLIDQVGVRPVFDPGDRGRFVGLEVLDENKARDFLKNIDSSGDPPSSVTRIDGSPTEKRIVVIGGSDRNRRLGVDQILENSGLKKRSQIVASRILKRLGGVDFHPFKTVRRPGETLLSYYNRVRTTRNADIRNGVSDVRARTLTGEADQDLNGDGVPDTPPENIDAADFGNEASREAAAALEGEGSRLSRLRGIGRSIISKASGPAAVVGVLCAVRDVGNQAEEIQFQNTILPMLRTGFRWMSKGAQILAFSSPTSDLSLDEIGFFVKELNDPETGSVYAAASIQHEMGKPITGPDIDPSVKPDSIKGKPKLFVAIDNIPGLGTACGVSSWISGLPVIAQVGQLSDAALSGVLTGLGLPTPQDIALSVASWLAGDGVVTDVVGPALGNVANYGARLAAGMLGFGMGGEELTNQEVGILDARNQQLKEDLRSKQSFFARVFDLDSTDSLAAITLRSVPTSVISSVSSLHSNMFAAISNPFSLFSSAKAGAAEASEPFDYGFSEIGFSASEQDAEQVQDPYAVASRVEANIADLESRYGQCFPTRIDVDTLDPIVQSDQMASSPFNQPEECDGFRDNADYLDYRFYINDTLTSHSLNCYLPDNAGDEATVVSSEESCALLGFNNEPIGSVVAEENTSTGECSNITGNERITCAAQNYFGVRYANYNVGTGSRWLEEWGVSTIEGSLGQRPREWIEERVVNGSNDFMECSGFTNVAIYEAFGVEIGPTCSAGYLDRTDYFTQISPGEARTGDFLIKSRTCGNNGHIGILAERLPSGEFLTMESSASRNDEGERRTGYYTRDADRKSVV